LHEGAAVEHDAGGIGFDSFVAIRLVQLQGRRLLEAFESLFSFHLQVVIESFRINLDAIASVLILITAEANDFVNLDGQGSTLNNNLIQIAVENILVRRFGSFTGVVSNHGVDARRNFWLQTRSGRRGSHYRPS